MKSFEDVKNEKILKKEIFKIEAKESNRFSKVLAPDEEIRICSCLVKTKGTTIGLFTGVTLPSIGWEHVLVRIQNRYPTYREMIFAKELFWNENELAFQVFPRKSEYVNDEEYTLHLWRNTTDYPNEEYLRQRILSTNSEIKQFFTGRKKNVFFRDEVGKRLLAYGEMCWPSWEEVCKMKADFWDKDESAVIFHFSKKIDDNSEYAIRIFDAKKLKLPPKEIV